MIISSNITSGAHLILEPELLMFVPASPYPLFHESQIVQYVEGED
jgi:hypothetical protein